MTTPSGAQSAAEAVLALGPWAAEATRKLGYRLPLFAKRGYHREYAFAPDGALNRPALDAEPCWGARPATPDKKPIFGPAPYHRKLWFAFGHAHQGLTLAAVTGRLLAEQMTGETPLVDLTPFSPARF